MRKICRHQFPAKTSSCQSLILPTYHLSFVFEPGTFWSNLEYIYVVSSPQSMKNDFLELLYLFGIGKFSQQT